MTNYAVNIFRKVKTIHDAHINFNKEVVCYRHRLVELTYIDGDSQEVALRTIETYSTFNLPLTADQITFYNEVPF